MDKRFAKFTEVKVSPCGQKFTNELMLDISSIIVIRATDLGTEIITTTEDITVEESFNDVRKILAI
nr:MAG TPA: hypothetical protein [Caudoviricetes sp.]